MPKIPCPIPEYSETDSQGDPVYWLEIPDEWTAEHAMVYDDVVEQTAESGLGNTVRTFAIALALCDDFNLPGLSRKQLEEKDMGHVKLEVITWVNHTVVINNYRGASNCPKGSSVPFTVLARMMRIQEESDGQKQETPS